MGHDAAERQLHLFAAFVHGSLSAFHLLGIVYNVVRRNRGDVIAHGLGFGYALHCVHKHAKAMALVLVLCPVAAVHGQSSRCLVTVRVTNGYARTVRFTSGPVALFAEVRVPRKAEHRWLSIEWDYAELEQNQFFAPSVDAADDDVMMPEERTGASGSALIPLDGLDASYRQDRKMILADGTYEVVARVYTDESLKKQCGFARTTVRVL